MSLPVCWLWWLWRWLARSCTSSIWSFFFSLSVHNDCNTVIVPIVSGAHYFVSLFFFPDLFFSCSPRFCDQHCILFVIFCFIEHFVDPLVRVHRPHVLLQDVRSADSSRSWRNSGEENAFPMVSSSISTSHKYEGSVFLSPDSLLEDHFSSLREVEVVKELGLITCGRREFCQRARLLSWRRRRVCLPWRCPHGGRGSGQSTGGSGKRRARWRRDTRKGTKRGTEKQRTTAHRGWPWVWGDAHKHDLEPMWCKHIIQCAHCAGEKWRVRCSCLRTPSVTVDRHRLYTKPAVTKKMKWPLKNFIMSSTSFWTCSSMSRLRKSAISWIAVEKLVLQPVRQTHGEDGFWEGLQLENLVEVAKARFFAWPIQGKISLSLVSFEFLCREMARVILFCQFVHLYALLFCPTNCELWFMIDLVPWEIDREFV